MILYGIIKELNNTTARKEIVEHGKANLRNKLSQQKGAPSYVNDPRMKRNKVIDIIHMYRDYFYDLSYAKNTQTFKRFFTLTDKVNKNKELGIDSRMSKNSLLAIKILKLRVDINVQSITALQKTLPLHLRTRKDYRNIFNLLRFYAKKATIDSMDAWFK